MKKYIIITLMSFLCFGSYAQYNDEAFADTTATDSAAIVDLIRTQVVERICGIEFGTSYGEAKRMLNNKYGTPDVDDYDKQLIVYKNKKYAGIDFDFILFHFENDGNTSYMNGCLFSISAKTTAEAKQKREMIFNKLNEKYYMKSEVDETGFKFYYGGISPLSEGPVIFLNIIKNKKDTYNCGLYSVQLLYGPFNYVKEEF